MAEAAAPPCGVFYVTDAGFVLPTVVSASQMRARVPATEADVHVVTIDLDPAGFDRLAAHLEPLGIEVWRMPSESFLGFDPAKFNQTHVPHSTLGRFVMLDAVPKRYERILYLDGDTWICGDPRPLVRYSPPKGVLAAAEGPSFFFRDDLTAHGRWTRAYFRRIGLDHDGGYFNAGMFAAEYDSWKAIAREAFDFFLVNTEACSYHDESALNAVCQHRRVRLSPQWNYNSAYRYWSVDGQVRPQICHFTGGPKPWSGRYFPWAAMYAPYQAAFAQLSHLGFSMRPEPAGPAQHRRNQLQWLQLRSLLLPRLVSRRREVAQVLVDSVDLG